MWFCPTCGYEYGRFVGRKTLPKLSGVTLVVLYEATRRTRGILVQSTAHDSCQENCVFKCKLRKRGGVEMGSIDLAAEKNRGVTCR